MQNFMLSAALSLALFVSVCLTRAHTTVERDIGIYWAFFFFLNNFYFYFFLALKKLK